MKLKLEGLSSALRVVGCRRKPRIVNSYRKFATGESCSSNVDSPSAYSFVTTPIFYVNSRPHIGHLYTSVLADAYHRFQKIRRGESQPAFLYTGTDEHGMKIEKAAKAAGCKSVIEHCDSVSNEFRQMCDRFNIDYNDFIRTTENRHKEAVSNFWRELKNKDCIYKSHYEGWYSVADEAFVTDSNVTESNDGKKTKISAESGHPVEWTSEENYMFKLSSYLPDVLHWIKTDKPVFPEKFEGILMRWIDEGFRDLSVSRPQSRLSWGISVPDDPSQVIYVWLDALVNYLTVAGYPFSSNNNSSQNLWPPTLQIVGKDILKFHGIYWPAFLIAAGLEPPRKILCHSHWTVDDKKMSKSIGNVVDPISMSEKYGNDGLRYFLLREGTPHSDSNFNEEKMRRFLNAELADTLGNLLNRCTAKAINPSQVWPSVEHFQADQISTHGENLMRSLEELFDKVETSYESLNFYRGLEHIMATVRLANLFVEEEKPWVLAKQSPQNPRLLTMLNLVFETLRTTAIIMQPVVPNLSTLVLDRLNIPNEERNWSDIQPLLWKCNRNTSNKDLGSFKSVFYARVKQE
ncbi:Methionine--tRNA ligase, mitochondrial [Orchesella cincta]|uniref:Methionine--tRNA ligase, mitochondrial n=1 Tax=Orchesella cincta TaxID=48709 RepID=A0A1D2N0K8_ORCCI|nr:Methionine--tRNA ligase, mitochondrial [Orchesella cincta]